MGDKICINAWLFYGICAMAAAGFIRAVIDLWSASKAKPSPFE